jgi:hypothetical protein
MAEMGFGPGLEREWSQPRTRQRGWRALDDNAPQTAMAKLSFPLRLELRVRERCLALCEQVQKTRGSLFEWRERQSASKVCWQQTRGSVRVVRDCQL